MHSGGKRGFSFAEVVVVIALLTIGLGITLATLNSPTGRNGSEALAKVFAEELRLARTQAMASGVPVGLAMPAAPTSEHASSQSYYILSGQVSPQITRVRQTDSDFAGAYLTHAAWAGDATTANINSDFDAETWQHPFPTDPTLIFLPSGKVTSNRLAYDGESYRVLVSSGVRVVEDTFGEEPPSSTEPINHRLAEASDAHTVTVSIDGIVKVHSGVLKERTLQSRSAPRPLVSSPPAVLTSTRTTTSSPRLSLTTVPVSSGPGPVELYPKQGLTLEFEAAGTFAPSVEWQGPGQFSTDGPLAMNWDPDEEVWKATVDFNIAPTTADGVHTITARMTDGQGNTSTETIQVNYRGASAGGTLVLAGFKDISSSELMQRNVQFEGEVRTLSLNGEFGETIERWSNGSSTSLGEAYFVPGSEQFLLLNREGLHLASLEAGVIRRVAGRQSMPLRWSLDGGRFGVGGSVPRIYSMDGTRLSIFPRIRGLRTTSWSPDLASFSGRLRVSGDNNLSLYEMDGNVLAELTNSAVPPYKVVWSRDNRKLIFAEEQTDSTLSFVVADADGQNRRVVATDVTPPGDGSALTTELAWAPDNKHYLVTFKNARPGALHLYHEDTGFVRVIPTTGGVNRIVGPAWISSSKFAYGVDNFTARSYTEMYPFVTEWTLMPDGSHMPTTVAEREVTRAAFGLYDIWTYDILTEESEQLGEDVPQFGSLHWVRTR